MFAIDTLKFARKLKESGLSQEVADAQAEVISETLNESVEKTLVTKNDLENAVKDLKREMKMLTFIIVFFGSVSAYPVAKSVFVNQDQQTLKLINEIKQEVKELKKQIP